MDEEFFLNDFSLENIDFDFNIYEEINVLPNETNILHTQKTLISSNLDHKMNLDHHDEFKPKAMMKMKNKPRVISFDFSNNNVSSSSLEDHEDIIIDRLVHGRGTKRKVCSSTSSSTSTRSPILAKEHVIAERKRREKLSQRFIALSSLLPGLKKADKLSVLDDATSSIKQLQEQLRKFEEEKESTKEIESMILVKKSKIFFNGEPNYLSFSPSYHENLDQYLPEIEAKVSQNQVLIRIQCEKSKVCMINILNMIENLQLCVENSVVLPFGESTLDITILAQMEKDFSVSVLKDLVRNIRLAMV